MEGGGRISDPRKVVFWVIADKPYFPICKRDTTAHRVNGIRYYWFLWKNTVRSHQSGYLNLWAPLSKNLIILNIVSRNPSVERAFEAIKVSFSGLQGS